jgi:hypothetical protein
MVPGCLEDGQLALPLPVAVAIFECAGWVSTCAAMGCVLFSMRKISTLKRLCSSASPRVQACIVKKHSLESGAACYIEYTFTVSDIHGHLVHVHKHCSYLPVDMLESVEQEGHIVVCYLLENPRVNEIEEQAKSVLQAGCMSYSFHCMLSPGIIGGTIFGVVGVYFGLVLTPLCVGPSVALIAGVGTYAALVALSLLLWMCCLRRMSCCMVKPGNVAKGCPTDQVVIGHPVAPVVERPPVVLDREASPSRLEV